MATVTRYTPFDETFDDLFKGFFVRPVSLDNQSAIQVRMDVTEDDGAYTVRAEMPPMSRGSCWPIIRRTCRACPIHRYERAFTHATD